MLAALRPRLALASRPALGPLSRASSTTTTTTTTPNAGPKQDQLRMIILGAPGAGKGTQGDRLLAKWDIESVVAGDLLRTQVREQTPLGKEAEKVMKAGGLLPDETVLALISPGLGAVSQKSWILDGFPRKASQAALLDTLLGERGLNLVVSLAVPDSVILNRITARWIHAPSNRSYNTDFPATRPKVEGRDDVTGELLTRRPDDTAEVFGKRLERFHEENEPLLDYYRYKNTKLADGREVGTLVRLEGDTSDEIWPQLVEIIEDRFPQLTKREE